MFTILKFTGNYCHPCKALQDYIDRHPIDGADIISANVEEYDDLVQRYGIRHIPTLILFSTGDDRISSPYDLNDSAEVNRWVGFFSASSLISEIQSFIKSCE